MHLRFVEKEQVAVARPRFVRRQPVMAEIVDAAEKAQEIDIERAKKALERARERLAMERGKQDVDHLRAEISLKRAIARIKVVQKSI